MPWTNFSPMATSQTRGPSIGSVAKLPPAHTLFAKRGARPRISRYWDLDFAPRQRSEAEACEELIEQLNDAVSVRLVSDVPLGAFLSGGVDSSAVVASMSSLSSEPVSCFSVEFGVRGFDETAYAREVAERFHARHVVDRVDPADLLSLDGLISTYDEPFGDSSALPTSRVCAAARRHVTVALSGDGGDEQFAGYRRYKWHVAEERVRRLLPEAFRQRLFATLAGLYPTSDGRRPRAFFLFFVLHPGALELSKLPPKFFATLRASTLISDGRHDRCGQSTLLRSLPNRRPTPSFIALRSPRIRCGAVSSATAWRGSYRDMTPNLSFGNTWRWPTPTTRSLKPSTPI